MDNTEVLSTISKKLGALISLQMESTNSASTTKEKVAFLKRFDLSSVEIAEIIGTTKNTVDVTASNLKKKQ